MTENKEIKDVKPTEPIVKSKKPTEKEMKWEADRDKEKVKGIFKNHENPGETLRLHFRWHPGEDIVQYELHDGQLEEIPLALARHLNKNCWVPQDQFCLDKEGKPSVEVGKKIRRFSFYPIGYVDLEDLSEVGTPMVTNNK